MNRITRKMLLNIATGIAVAMTAAVVFLPAAQAAPGTLTANVNVRSGPGTNFAVVDVVARGTIVDVQRCQASFCYISKSGLNGWVASSYLTSANGGANPGQPGFNFGINVPGGPSINIGVGNQPTPSRPPVTRPTPSRPPIVQPAAEVCFYDNARYRGRSECYRSGDNIRDLGRRFNGYQSIDNPRGLEVQVCTSRDYRDCRVYTTSASSLGRFGDNIVSIRVR
jgi:SH3-like domain-containing protein